ncbi:MAG TPA: hypothetical protein VIY86_10875, partial [Pirellulaceae bacterium]
VILDITNPEEARIDQVYDAQGRINKAEDVQLGITNVSLFAYVADGENGLRVIQLTSAETPGNDGFSPRPSPCLIATYKLPKDGHAVAISRGMDRDRAVDEAGHQLSVFGRVGARPLDQDDAHRLYLGHDEKPWYTTDDIWDEQFFEIPEELSRMRGGKTDP